MAPGAPLKTLCLGILLFSAVESARVKRAAANGACKPLPAPTNGKISCVDTGLDYTCTATCDSHFEFKTKEASVNRACDQFDGTWYDGKDIPECQPVCALGCLNGGSCVEPDKCACVDGWRGSHCQHHGSLCNKPPGPKFGSIQCTTDSKATVCKVACAPTFKFKAAPATEYKCTPDGTWTPPKDTIPDCEPGQVVQPTGSTVHHDVGEATCVAWSQDHYRTFDNKIYTFQGGCRYLLTKDCAFNTFDIHVINDGSCKGSQCKRELDIYMGTTTVSLRQGADGPEVTWNNNKITIPSSEDGVVFEKIGSYIRVSSGLGFKVKWDGKESIFVQIADDLKGKTCGLCGRYDGDASNDFETDAGKVVTSAASFGNSWKKTSLDGANCPDASQQTTCTTNTPQQKLNTAKATTLCQQLASDSAFSACHAVVDPAPYIEACKSDCCSDGTDTCACNTFEAYSRACMQKKINLSWRKTDRCPVACQNGMIYKECGSACQKKCQDTTATCSDDTCVDGCFCPDDTVPHNGQCINPTSCPCEHNGQEIAPGGTVPKDCNTCTCKSGKFECSTKKCEATCSATGDPHYMTFDGKRFNFMGTCSYYLIYDPNFDVIVDNIKCGHGEASCTKSVTLDVNGQQIKLDHNHQLFVNGKEITQLPFKGQGIKIFMVSSLFMQAELDNGIKILWDGRTRAYITAPPSFMKKTKGLCGYFDGNQNNDFLTKEGDVETNTNAFGNRWKTEASCRDMPTTPQVHPCDLNAQRKVKATTECEKLKGDTFKDCHGVVDVEQFYEDCLYDTCACTENLKDCMCPNFGEYADTCASKGIAINWRFEITECALQCTGGQEYQVCGSPCARTCRNIAEHENCQERCVEGCNCPKGQTLNDDGECVKIEECPCVFDGREYAAGYTTIKGTELCTCAGAKWNCQSLQVINGHSVIPTDKPVQSLCEENKMYTSCVSACPVTCDNVHDPPACTTTNCEPGCVCKPGFVKEGDRCVESTQCPCHHGGRAFFENEKIVMDCNECTCKSRKWECEMKDCPAICSTYGDSHYHTFDGKPFEFQGNCDYVLAKSTDTNSVKFQITTENIPCGTSGVTCTKAIEFTVGEPGEANFYRLNLVRGKPIVNEPGSPFQISEIGNYVYINTTFGITMQWDKGTTAYIRLGTQHRNKVAGLCGNFNGDQKDDFQMPQGGPPAVKATTFGDSWKVHDYCAAAKVITDTCDAAPHRKPWAQKKCGIMQSDLFEPCHHVVPYNTYMDKCIFDACACDLGGDCECLCTAIAAYAHECAVKGVPIRWRSNELCAIECTDCSAYNPCISTCPKKTCDNRLVYGKITKDCKQDLCFEGCDVQPCPPGQVYDSATMPMKCIPEPFCNTTACILNGREYREGERIVDQTVCRSECEICTCTSGELKRMGYCTGSTPFVAIPSAQPTVSPTAHPVSSNVKPTSGTHVSTIMPPLCLNGWTAWMSSSTPTHANLGDIETVEGLRKTYSFCGRAMMTAIECRVVGQNTKAEMSGQKVTCDLREGLKCYHKDQTSGLCLDYEVRYHCDCSISPSASPIYGQSGSPTASPTEGISGSPTPAPGTGESGSPTASPTGGISGGPTPAPHGGISGNPTAAPTGGISGSPTPAPGTGVSGSPTAAPTGGISGSPTASPTGGVSGSPTPAPGTGGSGSPTAAPTGGISGGPTPAPHGSLTGSPTAAPTGGISGSPSLAPGTGGSGSPTAAPTGGLSGGPTAAPHGGISGSPTAAPTGGISGSPTPAPGTGGSGSPTAAPHGGISGSPTASPTGGISGHPTPAPGTSGSGSPSIMTKAPYTCKQGWSSWMNVDRPTISHSFESGHLGDHEDLDALRYYYSFCAQPSSIQCRSSTTGKMYHLTDDKETICNIQQGFSCVNNKQLSGKCDDYEISVSCDCGGSPTAVPTAKPTFAAGIPTPAPGQPYQPIPSCMWTPWMNSHEKKSGIDGDYETISNLRLKYPFCAQPAAIQCRAVPSKEHPDGIPYDKTGEMGVSCNLNRGLVCVDSMQPNGKSCIDYEVRMYCTDACPSTVAPKGTPTAEPPKSETGFPTAGPHGEISGSATPSPGTGENGKPTAAPHGDVSGSPTPAPGTGGSGSPTAAPGTGGSGSPTASPHGGNSGSPTAAPTGGISGNPTPAPGTGGSGSPTAAPTGGISGSPTAAPTGGISGSPTPGPGTGGSGSPTASPHGGNSGSPTAAPTGGISGNPTPGPGTGGSGSPTAAPTGGISGSPTAAPTGGISGSPTPGPGTGGSGSPTASPHGGNSGSPTAAPTGGISGSPTPAPGTGGSGSPTAAPTGGISGSPTAAPTGGISGNPTPGPGTGGSGSPTVSPHGGNSGSPTAAPTGGISGSPTPAPGTGGSGSPTASPHGGNSGSPTAAPTGGISGNPTPAPGTGGSGSPTASPHGGNSGSPTAAPTGGISGNPTPAPGTGGSGSPTAAPTGGISGSPTAAPTGGISGSPSVDFCTEGWTGWINSDKPSTGNGDHETAGGIAGYPKTCMKVLSAECRVAATKEDYKSTGQFVTCDNSGLECINGNMQQCIDYEVRFYCYCGEQTPTPAPSANPSGSPTLSPPSGVSGQPEALVCNHGWTPMMNEALPSDIAGGDLETIDKLRQSNKFCDESNIIAIECVVSGTKTTHDQTGQQVTCDKKAGLICFNSQQSNKQCLDYAVRFFCDCAHSTPYNPVLTTFGAHVGSNKVTISPQVKITTGSPTAAPTGGISGSPTPAPHGGISGSPTPAPGTGGSGSPTAAPTGGISGGPTPAPHGGISGNPTASPTGGISGNPTAAPTGGISGGPTPAPHGGISGSPTASPTGGISGGPSLVPGTGGSGSPTAAPTGGIFGSPTPAPTGGISGSPTPAPHGGISGNPTAAPTGGISGSPTAAPTGGISGGPTPAPHGGISGNPTASPTGGISGSPTAAPTGGISGGPTPAPHGGISGNPTASPTGGISGSPTAAPTGGISGGPTPAPHGGISGNPTASPTGGISGSPTAAPTGGISGGPTPAPHGGISGNPTAAPTGGISGSPTAAPTGGISGSPTVSPTGGISGGPTLAPVTGGSGSPTAAPTGGISGSPTPAPHGGFSGSPTPAPGTGESGSPTAAPTGGISGSPTAAPHGGISGSPTAAPTGGISGSPTAQPSEVTTCVSYWSDWFNRDKPTSGGGDYEHVSPDELRTKFGFCSGGEISQIECYGVDTQAYYYSTGEQTHCDLKKGFTCNNIDNSPVNCQDYKIRYFCEVCAPTPAPGQTGQSGLPTPQPTGTGVNPTAGPDTHQSGSPTASPQTGGSKKPTPGPHYGVDNSPSIMPTTQNMPLTRTTAVYTWATTKSNYQTVSKQVCDIPMGTGDHGLFGKDQFTASTSFDYSFEAYRGRLGTTPEGQLAGAWMPRTQDHNQWIQVDLKHPEFITGVVTQGRPDMDNWVTKYTVSTSLDGKHFSPYTASGQTAALMFSGNSDRNTQVRGLFDHEILARYIRIQPVDWYGMIALRFDILSCTGLTSAPATYAPPLGGISGSPTPAPGTGGSGIPTAAPTGGISGSPTPAPGTGGSGSPTVAPHGGISGSPTPAPGTGGSGSPTAAPTGGISGSPTPAPGTGGSGSPTAAPTGGNSGGPTPAPHGGISGSPTPGPGTGGSGSPTAAPTGGISGSPTPAPGTGGSGSPTASPHGEMSGSPTAAPTGGISGSPTPAPGTGGSGSPTASPHGGNSGSPTAAPTGGISGSPTPAPGTGGSGSPTASPHGGISGSPTAAPTGGISVNPTPAPGTGESGSPTASPHGGISGSPTAAPTGGISGSPTPAPGTGGSGSPTASPHGGISGSPTAAPTGGISGNPTAAPGVVCSLPMGVDNALTVKDSQLTASGFSGTRYNAPAGRLFNEFGAWSPKVVNGDQWIMVNFLKPQVLNGILTQGSPLTDKWVTKFIISYSIDGFHFAPVLDFATSKTKIFAGNSDRNTVLKNIFPEPVTAQFIKVTPVEWSPAGIGMRFNIIGCYAPTVQVVPSAVPSGSPTSAPKLTTGGVPIATPPSVSTLEPVCTEPMGIENYRIVGESQLTSSSEKDKQHSAVNARISQGTNEFTGAWVPSPTDTSSWIQVDFLETKTISGILTQGSGKDNSWIEEFTVSYSFDGKTFTPYTDAPGQKTKTFTGNFDSTTIVPNLFNRNIYAQYIRIMPVTSHGVIALRYNILGCNPSPTNPLIPTVNTGLPTASPPVGQSGHPTAAQGTSCTSSKWTPWINKDKPDSGEGDYEKITPEQEKQYCSGGKLTQIKCQTVDGTPYYSAGEQMKCILESGSSCNNADNFPIPCSDYMIRYYCECGPGTDQGGYPTASPVTGTGILPTAKPGTDQGGLPTARPQVQQSGSPTYAPGQSGHPTLVPPFMTTPTVCLIPMGIESFYGVRDDQLTSSSSLNTAHAASAGRIYNTHGSWSPASTDKSWIQVDFLKPTLLSGVVTQGSPDSSRWVTKYYVYFGFNGKDFTPYTAVPGEKSPVLFGGNTDKNTPVRNLFNRDITAQYLRIVPVEWSKEGIGMRFNVLGCTPPEIISPTGIPTPSPGQSGVNPTASPGQPGVSPTSSPGQTGVNPTASPGQPGVSPTSSPGQTGVNPTASPPSAQSTPTYFNKCDIPMGIQNPGIIGGRQLTASSAISEFTGAERARPYTQKDGNYAGAWIPKYNDKKQWIQVDFGASYRIAGVSTQGRYESPTWVTKYEVYYSNDGHTFNPIYLTPTNTGPRVFEGNFDQNTPVMNVFPEVNARFIRIRPVEWNEAIGLRFNVFGCQLPSATPSVETITKAPVATPPVAPSVNPTVHVSPTTASCMYWTPWVNSNTPDTNGELESLWDLMGVVKVCDGTYVRKIECRTVKSKTPFDQTGEQGVKCDLDSKSLVCMNSDQTTGKVCSDYELRFFCDECSKPTPSPGQSIGLPTAAPQTCNNKWSGWINRNTPDAVGETETVSKTDIDNHCPGGTVAEVECETVRDSMLYYLTGDTLTCDAQTGLTCKHSDNVPLKCHDYKIRFKCKCENLPTASPPQSGQSGHPTPVPGTSCTTSSWTPWINTDKPDVGGGDYEKITLEQEKQYCTGGKLTKIECMTDTGISYYSSGEVVQCTMATGSTCANADNFPITCSDYKVRYYCECLAPTASPSGGLNPTAGPSVGPTDHLTASPVPGQSGLPTASPSSSGGLPSASPQSQCSINKWSSWINRDHPNNGEGDFESMTQQEMSQFCPGGEITEIKCETVDGIPSYSSGDIMTCDRNQGSSCKNADNFPIACRDYQIRYYCKCSPTASPPTGHVGPTASPGTQQSGLPTASPTSGISGEPSAHPNQQHTGSPTPAPVVTTCSQSHFSNWVNRDLPDTGNGDHEFMTPQELNAFCKGGKVTKVECYSGDIPSYSSGELMTCDLKNGALCNNADNFPVTCSDYKIRYFCDCSGAPQPVTTTAPDKKYSIHCDWSPWINTGTPESGHGDMETIDAIKTQHGVCKDMRMIECRIAGTNTMSSASGQSRVTCDVNNGLRCFNNEQLSKKCYDYEVRVLCWDNTCNGTMPTAGPTPAPQKTPTGSPGFSQGTTVVPLEGTTTAVCAPGQMWYACAHTCDEVCHAMSGGICDGTNPQQCIPGCKEQTATSPKCANGEKLSYTGQCVKAEMCPCRKPDGSIAQPFEYYTNPTDQCSKCHCFNNSDVCQKDDQCIPTAGPSVIPTTHPSCDWTNWINVDKPTTGDGDIESLLKIRSSHSICTQPVSIECRETSTKTEAMNFGEKVSCDIVNGFRCFNWENQGKCSDYEVRFYCPCASTVSPNLGGLPTASPSSQSGLPTAGPSSQSGLPTAGPSSQSGLPTAGPSSQSGLPTAGPSSQSGLPTAGPSSKSGLPTAGPSSQSGLPTAGPSSQSGLPTAGPSSQSGLPTAGPSSQSGLPTAGPSSQSGLPTAGPSSQSGLPTAGPSSQSGLPTAGPSSQSGLPTAGPSSQSGLPTAGPSSQSGLPTAGPSSQSGLPTTSPIGGISGHPTASPALCGWSAWTNSDHPSITNPNKPFEGDIESIASLMTKTLVCGHEMMKKVECRAVGTKQMASATGQVVTCDTMRGLRCDNSKQGQNGKCLDYEIRVFCDCSSLPTASPTNTGGLPTAGPGTDNTGLPTAAPHVCGWSTWMNGHTPDTTGEMELLQTLRNQYQFCKTEDITALECRNRKTLLSASESGQVDVICDLKYSGLMCSSSKQITTGGRCYDYEIRVLCEPQGVDCSQMPTASPGIGQSGLPTASPGTQTGVPTNRPGPGHSEHPTASPGSHAGVPTSSPGIGQSGLPTASPGTQTGVPTDRPGLGHSELPTASPGSHAGVPTSSPGIGQSGLPTASPGTNTGVPTDKPGPGHSEHPTASPGSHAGVPTSSPGIGQSGLPTASPGTNTGVPTDKPGPGHSEHPTASPGSHAGVPTSSPGIGQSGLPTAQPPQMTTCAAYWSQWINTDKPGTGGGDFEHVSPQDLVSKYSFCKGGQVTKIQCYGADMDADYSSTGDLNACDLKNGLSCKNSDNFPVPCQDYKIRYFCEVCAPVLTPTSSPLPHESTTPVLVCPNPMTNTATLNVPDHYLTASSSLSAYAGPERSRIDAVSDKLFTGAWMPKTMDKSQWIEARFDHAEYINAIITKGREGSAQWVKSFMVAYSMDGKSFHYYEENPGTPKVFNGNFDGDTQVRSVLQPIIAKFIRIQPISWEGAIALRFSIIGCRAPEQVLPTPAPSTGSEGHPTAGPQQSCVTSTWSKWINKNTNPDGDYESMTKEEIATFCPSGSIDKVECITVDDIPSFSTGEVMTCTPAKGLVCDNADNFPIPCSDYKIRYHCKCSETPTASPGVSGSGKPTASPGLSSSGLPTAKPGVDQSGQPTASPVKLTAMPTPNVPSGCKEEMGMKNGRIRDDMITASSYRDGRHSPTAARLGSTTSWLAATEDKNQYIQVNFLAPRIITGISTQGRPDAPSYVTSYKVYYSYDGTNWSPYREAKGQDKVFSGNFDNVTPVTNMFLTPVRAQYIRINPQTWSQMISMRFEIHGCYESYPTQMPPSVNPLNPTASPLHPDGQHPTASPPGSQTLSPLLPAGCVIWDKWINLNHVTLTSNGDHEPIEDVKKASTTCQQPMAIECITATPAQTPSDKTGQKVSCNLWEGLLCKNAEQKEPMCFDYKVRLGCLKQTQECLSKAPTVIPSSSTQVTPTYNPNIIPCYTGMDLSKCPKDGCQTGQFCDGLKCVPKSECPCLIEGRVVLPGQISQNSYCDTCQCVAGEVKCLPMTCPTCQGGLSAILDKKTCQCECQACAPNEYKCGTGQCIPQAARCDGVADCTTDEFECMSTPIFTMPGVPTPKPTMPGVVNPSASPSVDTKNPTLHSVSPTGGIVTPSAGVTYNDLGTTREKVVTTGMTPGATDFLPPHVPIPVACVKVQCTPLVAPPLKQGEVLQKVKTKDGCCEEYLVVCEPQQCPAISIDCMKPEVITRTVKGDRCCPEYTCVCPTKCPVPTEPPCAFGSQVVEIVIGCNCTTKACVAGTPIPILATTPAPICRYTMTKKVQNGKEVDLVSPTEVIHSIGESWSDGLCKSCQCINSTRGTPETSCKQTQCPACNLGEERRFKANTCCGDCVKTGCVVNGTVYKAGEKIQSTQKCFEMTCKQDFFSGDLLLQKTQVQCERMEKLPKCVGKEDRYDVTGCCLRCVPSEMVPTNSSSVCQSCTPRLMFGQPQHSVGFFKVQDNGEDCENIDPVLDLKECSGYCGSTSSYTHIMRGFDNKCKCCQPAKTISKNVELHCSSGRKITKTYNVPETCGCSACAGGA